jgi:archaeal flagellar protein FlaI
MQNNKAPPSVEYLLDDCQCSESPAVKPQSVKVKMRRKLGLPRFGSKKKEALPNCASEKNVIIGSSRVSVSCEGCPQTSDLSDPECMMRCALLLETAPASSLTLDDGLCKKEYGVRDLKWLGELSKISQSLQLAFPEECGICAREHEAQLGRLRAAILRNPSLLLQGAVEISENPDMTVKVPDRKVCDTCRKNTEKAVDKALGRLKSLGACSFSPLVRPFFSNSRVLFRLPEESTIESSYENAGAKVVISKGDEEVYSIFPPEYRLGKRKLEIMKEAYKEIAKKAGEKDFMELCKRELLSASARKGLSLDDDSLMRMAESLVRCTRGLDVVELLLRDAQLQDVYINSPIDTTPLYVKHRDFDDCRTNVFLSEQAARNFVSKFRLRSGRAFSEVSPILDMELPEWGIRANITGPPVSPDGLAFAFRRASEEPWTLLRFIGNRMISPLAAGLLAMMVNEESTILMCGDRGSGKTSMLSALVGAMPIKHRILTIEDTFEIPVPALASEGFRMQRMRIRPSTAGDSHEMSADAAMRSLLRMGDSAIVMGEVRGSEAKTLYEAMNVGGSGNCVLGTIHGKSPRSLLERVIFSLGVPPQSFKATDLVVIADRVRPGGGSKKLRRVAEIAEVRKSWDEPDAGKVFSQLMAYDRKSDMLEACDNLNNPEKSELLSRIAGKRGVAAKAVLSDINARAQSYSHAVALSSEVDGMLSVKTMVALNREYLRLVDESILKFGSADYDFVGEESIAWLDRLAFKEPYGLRNAVQ